MVGGDSNAMKEVWIDMTKQNNNNLAGPILVLLGGSMWGCMGLLVRLLEGLGMDSMEIAVLRTGISFLVLGMSLFLYNRNTFRIRIKDLWCFLGSGILSLSVFCVSYFQAIRMTSLSVAAVLLYTAPAFVMLMSFFLFKERLDRIKIAALILAFAGCVFVTGMWADTPVVSPAGLGFGLLSGFGYALYSIFSRFAMDRGYQTMTITLYTFLFATIGVIPFTSPRHMAGVLAGAGAWVLIKAFCLILFVTVAPYLCYTAGLSRMEPGRASVIASIEPVVATVIGTLVYKEPLYWYSYVGILLVLFSIILINRKK